MSGRSDGSTPAAVGPKEFSERHREALGRLIVFWGEMASNWGINRTMAQIHALLYCSEEPLDTDTIMEWLEISRGNANMNLRSLVDWKLVRKTHRPDSRKDFYEAEKDVWTITAQIIQERERREIQPVREQLSACRSVLVEGEADCGELEAHERYLCERIENLMQLMELFDGFSAVLLPLVERRDTELMRRLVAFAQLLNDGRASSDQRSAEAE